MRRVQLKEDGCIDGGGQQKAENHTRLHEHHAKRLEYKQVGRLRKYHVQYNLRGHHCRELNAIGQLGTIIIRKYLSVDLFNMDSQGK